jgi:hypothetical protein
MGRLGWIALGFLTGSLAVWLLLSHASMIEGGDARPTVVVRVVNAHGEVVANARVAGVAIDASGTCEIRVAAEQAATLAVGCEGYCPAEVRLEAMSLGARIERWVRLERGRAIEATILRKGTTEPVPGARLQVELSRGPGDAKSPRVVTSDADGIAHIDGVPDCLVQLQVVPPGYMSRLYRLELVEGRPADPITLEASPATRVAVEIVDREGRRVPRAHLFTPYRYAVSDNGTFEADVLEGQDFAMDALDTSWAHGALRFIGDGRPERHERLVLTPAAKHPNAHELRLRVTDGESRRPIPDAHVKFDFASPLDRATGTYGTIDLGMRTDAHGWLIVPAVPLDALTASASHPSYLDANVVLTNSRGVLTGELRLRPKPRSRTITGRPEHPVRLSFLEPGGDSDESGAFELVFDESTTRTDIRYRPNAEISRECVVRDVAVGSQDVILPLYPTGDLLICCTDEAGRALPRACVAVHGRGFRGATWKEDPKGEMLIRSVPAGDCDIWVQAWGRAHVGPLACSLRQGESTRVEARFDPPLAVLALRVETIDGRPLEDCRLLLLDAARDSVIGFIPEQFLNSPEGQPIVTTLSDGRRYIPLQPQELVLALQTVIGEAQGTRWGTWGSPLFGFQRLTIPRAGFVDAHMRLGWRVFVSRVDPDSPAMQAGFQRGDVVLSWDGRDVHDLGDCSMSGQPISVTVRRGNDNVDLRLTPTDHGLILDRLYHLAESR